MTPPMTPREKVVFKQPCEHCQRMTTVDLTALASGSGDHAELARLAEAATEMVAARDALTAHSSTWKRLDKATVAYSNAINRIEPATVLALLAENAALRSQSENARTVVAWANNSLFGSCGYFHGEPFDGLHLARPIEALKSRATEAERKLAEAVGHVEQLVDRLHSIRDSSIVLIAARNFLSKEAERG